MGNFENLRIVDSETGDEVIVSAEDWAKLHKLADNPDDVLSNLPNSGDPVLQKFFADLTASLMAAIDKDNHAAARESADAADAKLHPKGSALANAMREAIAQLSTLTPAQLKVAKALGPLFINQANEEKIGKAVLKDEKSTEEQAVADTRSLLEAVMEMSAHPKGPSQRLV
jgi:hypothetical protein